MISKIRNYSDGIICKMPAIALTALADNDSRDLAIDQGFDTIVFKPCDFDLLIETVKIIIINYNLPRI
ncbi:hypothetical protein CAL7716_042230 [Calothrix sp. PCC 7716]|nr:hypothetical protein CAL7716_042230 [Calothrix sp. PCC 7716]